MEKGRLGMRVVVSMLVLALTIALALLALRYFLIGNGEHKRPALTRADLPTGVTFIKHEHPSDGEEELDADGNPKAEMEHWGTPEAVKSGGPIYGVYGYSIVAVEYQIPASQIGSRTVGKDFAGWDLSDSGQGFASPIPYDHFHIGIMDIPDDGHEHTHEETYIVHYMLLPHAEELKIGLSCS